MTEKTSLTVVIPTHDRSVLLAEAIESVLRSRLVTRHAVVVVDDGSADETAEVAKRFGVRYKFGHFGGPSRTRNAGLDLADTDFVTFLDDDDRWLDHNIEPQLAALREEPGAGFAYARVQMTTMSLDSIGEPFPPPPLLSGHVPEQIYQRPPQLGVVVFRREALRAVGGFDPDLRYGEDGDLMFRVAGRFEIVGVDFVGLLFRQREPSLAEGEARWLAHQTFAGIRRKWARNGPRLSWKVRLRAAREYRGRFSYYMCRDAEAALARGERRGALRLLSYALRISPVHSLLRLHLFWSVFRRVTLPGQS